MPAELLLRNLPIFAAGIVPVALYLLAVRGYRRRRGRAWPLGRTLLFCVGSLSGIAAVASPLDDIADGRFSAHMFQHLILTDLTAPLLLLGAPLLLLLGSVAPAAGRRVVAMLKSKALHILTFPLTTWTLFIVSLWAIHFSPFFELALESESLHVAEHAIYLTTALLFWQTVIAIGPAPWSTGPLAFPMRMLYLFAAMPAEGFLGFSIYGARHVLYPHYAASGVADQQLAGELMWIGSGVVMFGAFMCCGYEWAQHEERAALRSDTR